MKTAKKLSALLLCALTVLGIFTVGVSAEAEYDEYLTYVENDGEIRIVACTPEAEGEIVIPAAINEHPVTAIGYDAFRDCKNVTGVIIPDSVNYIGEGAFYECDKLAEIVIPSGVTEIDEITFYGCESLSSVTFPAGIKEIGKGAFELCNALTDVYYAGSITDKNGINFNLSNFELVLSFWHYNSDGSDKSGSGIAGALKSGFVSVRTAVLKTASTVLNFLSVSAIGISFINGLISVPLSFAILLLPLAGLGLLIM